MKKVLLSLFFVLLVMCAVLLTVSADGTGSSVRSITIESYPTRTVYDAFDRFDSSGLVVSCTLSDGNRVILPNEELSFTYQHGDVLRAGDEYVLISYAGHLARLPVTVNRISYPLDAVISDVTVTYNGEYQSYTEVLPTIIGLDGVPLCINAVGGGTNVGEYEIYIEFSSDSTDYLIPESRVVSMIVEPMEAKVLWSNLSYVYDGKIKVPTAEYMDAKGERVSLSVLGGAKNAGVYTARVGATNTNYVFINTSADYEIKKADYDTSGVSWSGTSFVYDGNKRSVTLKGLPQGVSVVGYSGNLASDAGKYTATARISWDDENYNPPVIASHDWEITPAEYDLSGFKFKASSFTYDGNPHYPILEGQMPVGSDGIPLEYSFSIGATHVSEGNVSVVITFKTESKNYILPKNQYSSVKITPLGINATWGEGSLYYNGERQVPTATANECGIKVSGGGVTVGRYTATAEALNSDYYVVNSTCDFTILKAQNCWAVQPSASTCYEGREIRLVGESKFGEVKYLFFSDREGSIKIPTPTAQGKYYARLVVSDSMNYSGLESEIISFEIVPIKPVSFVAEINKDRIFAFDRLTKDDLICSVVNNDGSAEAVDSSLVEVVYQNGDSFRKKDDSVILIYGSFSLKLPVEVEYANYDMSGAFWSDLTVEYNGKPQTPALCGLPEGVSFVGTAIEDMIDAGTYTVEATLSYDEENYNSPSVPSCIFTINKKTLDVPLIMSTYNGEHQIAVSDSLLYRIEGMYSFRDVGVYSVKVILNDNKNYCFEGGGDTTTATYEIKPIIIKVKVGDLTLHLFEKIKTADYKIIEGGVLTGDFVGLDFYIEDNKVMAVSKNANYLLDVSPGRLVRLPYPTLLDGLLMCMILICTSLLIIGLWMLFKKKGRLATVVGIIKCRIRHRHFKAAEPIDEPRVIESHTVEENIRNNPFEEEKITIYQDAPHADMLITDAQAKSLVRREGDVVYTEGTGKVKISVGELSDSFSAGDVVDINSMKSAGLVDSDAGYVKVTEEGRIDKALTVYANDFSLSSVKMIALTGGSAIKSITMKGKPIKEKE